MGVEKRFQRDARFKKQKLTKTKQRREALDIERHQRELRSRVPRNDLLPRLEVCLVSVGELRPSPHRTRKIAEDHVERLMGSIADLGFTIPILKAGVEIIDGHVRVEAARRLRHEHVPAVDVSHLPDVDVRKLALAANRLAELGEWDLDLLRIEFQELIDLDADLDPTGFTLEERDIVLLDPVGLRRLRMSSPAFRRASMMIKSTAWCSFLLPSIPAICCTGRMRYDVAS